MTKQDIDKILETALSYEGYLEKNTADYNYYENPVGNSGKNNFTRFGRISDMIMWGADKRRTDGNYWCAMFVLSCIYESKAGKVHANAQAGTLTPNQSVINWMKSEIALGGSLSGLAGCDTWKDIYRKHGRIGKTPQIGAFVIFMKPNDDAYHIGIVVSVGQNGAFTTIEGNTDKPRKNSTQVNPNGGGVWRVERNIKTNNVLFLYPQDGEGMPVDGEDFVADADYGTMGSMSSMNANYGGSTSYSPNRVTNLSKARNRQEGTEPNINETRKNDFSALADRMISETPALGRDIVKSQEMYDSCILKGDQVSKRRVS